MSVKNPAAEVAAQVERHPEEATTAKSIELGRGVLSPQYGKGWITDINGEAIKVRFAKYGHKTFHKTERGYPFELLDKVYAVKKLSVEERVLARETRTEKKERALRCPHRDNRSLCPKCADLSASEIEKWNLRRTKERRVRPRWLSLNQYNRVKLASNDCCLVSRPPGGALAAAIRNFGEGARGGDYADARPARRVPNSEEAANARDFFMNSNGGVVIGNIRTPLDAPRGTRADTPAWIEQRGRFLQTLTKARSKRGERILRGYYVEEQTDQQIAECVGWSKDAIKKERKMLVEKGEEFFGVLATKHPPRAAIGEKVGN
jgi:hypothetical protein